MKKGINISIFVLLTGMFAGLFFSMELSESNLDSLSEVLISSIKSPPVSFFKTFLSSVSSNFIIAVLMIAASLSRFLLFVPFVLLWYKSFAIGFCSGLIYLNDESAFIISLTRLFPSNLFFIPAFVILAAVTFTLARNVSPGNIKRSFREKKDLQIAAVLSLAGIIAGSIIEAFFYMIPI